MYDPPTMNKETTMNTAYALASIALAIVAPGLAEPIAQLIERVFL